MTAHDQISTPDGLRRFAAEWLGVDVGEPDARRWSAEALRHKERWETAAGPFAWVKNRLLESGLIPYGGASEPAEVIVTAILHVGFLSLLETSEMLARLSAENTVAVETTARSRLGKRLAVTHVSPVDATAARVFRGDRKRSR